LKYVSGPAEFIDDETIHIKIVFMLYNEGPGIANNLFMNAKVFSIPGDNCDLMFIYLNQAIWDSQITFKMHFSAITRRDVLLPPEA
jgi:hypothetical protein